MRRSVKKITCGSVVLAVWLLGAAPLGAQGNSSSPRALIPLALDTYIRAVRDTWQIPGLAVAIVHNDSTIATGYGVRELGRPGAVDERTLFDAASLSKSFTATAVATLVDAGIVQWDDPVSRYMPTLALATPELTAAVTFRDFLSHRSGLAAPNMHWVVTAIDRDDLIRRMRYVPVAGPTGQTWIYSNIGYTVAGVAAAAAANTTFEALLRDRLIRPLGLASTAWTYEMTATMTNAAAPHATIGGKQVVIPRETQRAAIGPAAAIQTSAIDLARWMRLHLNNGILDGRRFVSDSTMREMHRMQVIIPTTPSMRAARNVQGDSAGYGLGWQVMDYQGHRLLWHTGNGDGQIAYMALLPDDHLAVAVLVNTWSAPNVHAALVNRIIDHYLGFPPRDWAAEAFARIPRQTAQRDSAVAALERGLTTGPLRRPRDMYVGTYTDSLYGPVIVRADSSRLTLQMGRGRIAVLESLDDDRFLVRWVDPFFREYYLTSVQFGGAASERATTLELRLNGERIAARRDPPPHVIKGGPLIDNP